jgi:hypothetical protein
MGFAPPRGEDQEVVVSITGPEKGVPNADVEKFNADFKSFTEEVQALRKKYPRLKVRVSRISYMKKDPQESFEYRPS